MNMTKMNHDNKPVFTFEDLVWKTEYLGPLGLYRFRDTFHLKKRRRRIANDPDTARETDENIILQGGNKTTKIADCGYDMIACCYTALPADCDFELGALVTVDRFLADGAPVFQEGFGLFVRDNMDLDPTTGYPYSNMALAGGCLGNANLFIRSGVTETDHDDIQNVSLKDRSPDHILRVSGEPLRCKIRIQMDGQQFRAEMTDAEGRDLLAQESECAGNSANSHSAFTKSGNIYRFALDRKGFTARDKKHLYVGFLAAGNTSLSIDKSSIELMLKPAVANRGSVLYASPNGDPLAAGDREHPMDLTTAITNSSADTIHLLPGRYFPESDLILGERYVHADSMRIITGDPENPSATVIDFAGSDHALKITGDYWALKNLTVTNGMGIQISGSHNRLTHCLSSRHKETGILIRHPDNNANRQDWPSFNKIADCVSCLNCDDSERNADGFACKVTAGAGNEFIRCVSFLNSDDGFDLFTKNRAIGKVKLTSCKSALNGYRYSEEEGLVQAKGHGTGFKLGGSGVRVRHLVRNCVAEGNKDCGFTSNSNPSIRLINCTARNNQKGSMRFYYTGTRQLPEKVVIHFKTDHDPEFDKELLCQKLLNEY